MTENNKNYFEGYVTVKETEAFRIMYNPNLNPLEVESVYILVYKPFNTVEIKGNSYCGMLGYLSQAESLLESAIAMMDDDTSMGVEVLDEKGNPTNLKH